MILFFFDTFQLSFVFAPQKSVWSGYRGIWSLMNKNKTKGQLLAEARAQV